MSQQNNSAKLSKRLSALVAKIKEYKPDFQENTLREAVKWSHDRMKARKLLMKHDEFSDPLLIADKLVDYAKDKIDGTAILAAILYPSVRSKEGAAGDTKGMEYIQNNFGSPVHDLVKRTLHFRALDNPPLEADSKQTEAEHLYNFRVMGLWVATDPRAILIRATQFAINLANATQELVQNVGKRKADDDWNRKGPPPEAWMKESDDGYGAPRLHRRMG